MPSLGAPWTVAIVASRAATADQIQVHDLPQLVIISMSPTKPRNEVPQSTPQGRLAAGQQPTQTKERSSDKPDGGHGEPGMDQTGARNGTGQEPHEMPEYPNDHGVDGVTA